MSQNFTNTFRVVMELSTQKAKELGAQEITLDHIAWAIVKEGTSTAIGILQAVGLNVSLLLEEYTLYLYDEASKAQGGGELLEASETDPRLGAVAMELLSDTVRRSTERGDEAVSPHHLLESLLESSVSTYLQRRYRASQQEQARAGRMRPGGSITFFGVMPAKDIEDLLRGRVGKEGEGREGSGQERDDEASDEGSSDEGSDTGGTSGKPSGKRTMLARFGRDLTLAAKEGRLDPMVGRTRELERMVQILGRRKKCNPILIGEPGVGKTTLVEGLAMRIARREVPMYLLGKRLVEIDLPAIVAGTKFRGEFEERLKRLVQELEEARDVIVFIDEIHNMVGAGSSSGTMDAANMLKPALSRGAIQCIGSTTLSEYRKHIEKDGALERRFQRITLEPSTPEETRAILGNLRPYYERHHRVRYTDEALEAMVALGARYITERFFPDKAIDLMDESGARFSQSGLLGDSVLPQLLEQQEETLRLKREAILAGKMDEAKGHNERAKHLQEQIAQLEAELQHRQEVERTEITPEHIAEVVSTMTGIPLGNIAGGEVERLRQLESKLKDVVIGQDPAIERLSRSIKRSRLGLRDGKRPIGSFLFLGPTGVGKTYLAKQLSRQLFGSEEAMIRIDMSEYMEKFAVSRLVGAPPGYVGYEEGGQLTEQVRRRPYSVILFDEIEKAHPDIFNILLQVLDDGMLTDSEGHKVDFRNAVIIITSNVGSRQAKAFGRGIGYQDAGLSTDRTADIMRKALEKAFSPEFLNRLDEIIEFAPLDREALRRIVDVELRPVAERIASQGYHLELDDAARDALAKEGFHPEYGARPLRRTLQREVEDRITDLILEDQLHQGDTLRLTADESGRIVQVSQ